MNVVVLCGAENSGKTTTLEALAELFDERVTRRRYFRHWGKLIAIFYGSRQEKEPFCHFKEVRRNVLRMLRYAEQRGCVLVILPFTLQFEAGRINTKCIKKPIERLEVDEHQVHVVYLRREVYDDGEPIEGLELMDRLVRPIAEEEIPSEDNPERQARRLFRFLERIDP